MNRTIEVTGHRRGLHEITSMVADVVRDAGLEEALCTVFVKHTSAGVCIQENADPSARRDMEAWFDRVAPEDEPWYTHVDEGPDDMPAHIKAAMMPVSLAIPVSHGQMVLGQWQGIYLFEHRDAPHQRNIVLSLTT